jgi:hypothetical protein
LRSAGRPEPFSASVSRSIPIRLAGKRFLILRNAGKLDLWR